MTGLLIDVEQSKVQIVTDASSLQDYYKLLNCDLIDIVRRRIGGRHYNIICDEEGLLKDNCTPSAFDSAGYAALVGNLLIMGPDIDELGEMSDLKPIDIMHLQNHIHLMYTNYNRPEGYFVVTDCEY